MARNAVARRGVSIRLACEAFGVSQTCYRYERKRNAKNEPIADWLLRLTDNHRSWGFGLCFLYLRNVKGFGQNHERIYHIYRELELDLRIKPRKRPVRRAPEPLVVPMSVNAPKSNPTYRSVFPLNIVCFCFIRQAVTNQAFRVSA